MKLEIENWAYILNNCESIFEKEPVLELAMGRAFVDIQSERIKPAPLNFIIKSISPIYFFLKKIHSKNQIKEIIDAQDVKKPYGVFDINETRADLFNTIFPIIKKMDEMGENTLLLTKRKVYSNRKEEIDSLNNNSVIFFEDLLYHLSFSEILDSYRGAHVLYDKLLQETKDEKITDFERKYRNKIVLSLEIILVFSKSLSKIIANKNCLFLFSKGTPWFGIVGKKYGIRTMMIQHGFHGRVVRNHIQYSPQRSDEKIVWGEKTKTQIFPVCGSNKKIFALGNPRYDNIIDQFVNKERDKEFYKKLNIDPKKKNVVFFSSTHGIDMGFPSEKYIEPIFALDELYQSLKSEINLIIKLHPNETKKYYKQYMKKSFGEIPIIKHEIPLYELLQHTDISMTVDSTTTLESMLFKIPTLQLGLTKHKVIAEYHKHGASILITEPDELIDTVKRIVSGTYDVSKLVMHQKRYLEMNLANLGNATNKIVEHLLKKKKKNF